MSLLLSTGTFVKNFHSSLESKSATGRKWRLKECDDRLALMLSQRLNLPEIVGRLLSLRGVNGDSAEKFLNPTLRDWLPDPYSLKDMEKAVSRLVRAINDSESIAIFGDYDVDGATSSALLARFFNLIGVTTTIYIPDRIKEGYGPNERALLQLRSKGIDVVITVDCGITAFKPIASGAMSGLDIIIVDHHVAEPKLPDAFAVINPNRLDDKSDLGRLAAVGVTFLLAVAINRSLRESGFYCDENKFEPNLLDLLDLVALGTVCDLVKLDGLNRAYVNQGLKIMARRTNTGMTALFDEAKINEKPSEYHAGYVLGPRVNAGGRVGESSLGARLLSTNDIDEARYIANQLDTFNNERKKIESTVFNEAISIVESGEKDKPILIIEGDGWHSGVIGIVASRIKDKYAKPVFVISFDGDKGKGSGRSISNLDLGSIVISARQKGIIDEGGGHKMAAGLSVNREKLSTLRDYFYEQVNLVINKIDTSPVLDIDSIITLGGANTLLVNQIQKIAPFGSGNPEPRFMFPNVKVVKADIVGDNHLRCILSDENKNKLNAIAFRVIGEELGDILLLGKSQSLHVAGKIRINQWQGREDVQLLIDDVRVS